MKIPFPKYDEALVQAIEEELDQVHLTEITYQYEMMNFAGGDADEPGTEIDRYLLRAARGSGVADADRSVVPRMMIQSIPAVPETRRRSGMIYTDPCAACDNFAISWKCDEHPELDYDSEKHRWIKPGSFDPFATPFEPVGDPFVNAVPLDADAHLDPDGAILGAFTGRLADDATDRERITALGAYLERLAELEGSE